MSGFNLKYWPVLTRVYFATVARFFFFFIFFIVMVHIYTLCKKCFKSEQIVILNKSIIDYCIGHIFYISALDSFFCCVFIPNFVHECVYYAFLREITFILFLFQVRWMMYWIVFALFTVVETVTDLTIAWWVWRLSLPSHQRCIFLITSDSCQAKVASRFI